VKQQAIQQLHPGPGPEVALQQISWPVSFRILYREQQTIVTHSSIAIHTRKRISVAKKS
jgi:hypothetical protein